MRQAILVAVGVMLFGATGALRAQKHDVKLTLTPNSTVPSAGILKEMSKRCPNVSLTLDASKAEYTFEAGADRHEGEARHYRFTLFNHSGDPVFATTTYWLRNAVKDVCGFVNSQGKTPRATGQK